FEDDCRVEDPRVAVDQGGHLETGARRGEGGIVARHEVGQPTLELDALLGQGDLHLLGVRGQRVLVEDDHVEPPGASASKVRQMAASSKTKGWIIGVVTPAAAKAARRARHSAGEPMMARRSTMSSVTAPRLRARSLARQPASIARASSAKPHQATKRL